MSLRTMSILKCCEGRVVMAALICAVSSMIVYWPVVHNGLVWDDLHYLLRYEYRDPRFGYKVLAESFLESQNYFRPLVVFTFLLQNWLGGGPDPFHLHLLNVLLHGLNTGVVVLLLCHFLQQMGGSSRALLAGAAVGLLYGVHPTAMESVGWISGRFDVMLTTFMLLAFLADSYLQHKVIRPLMVGILFAGGAFCKEMAIVFPLVLAAWHLAIAPRPIFPLRPYIESLVRRGELSVYGAIVLAGVAYLIVRYVALGYVLSVSSEAEAALARDFGAPDPNLVERLLLIAKSAGWYLLLTIYPFSFLSPVHPESQPIAIADPWAWGSAVGLVAIGWGVYRLWRAVPHLGWLWLAALLSFLPVVQIIPLNIADNIVHERFMLFPLTLVALALAASFTHVGRAAPRIAASNTLRWTGWSVFFLYLSLSVLSVRSVVPIWHDDLRLWTWAVQRYPQSQLANLNLSERMLARNMPEQGLRYALSVLRLNRMNTTGLLHAGEALRSLGLYDDSLRFYELAMARFPRAPSVLNDVAVTLIYLGQYDRAEMMLNLALELDPMVLIAKINLARLYALAGKDQRAASYFEDVSHYLSPRLRSALEKDLARYSTERRVLAGDSSARVAAQPAGETRIDPDDLHFVRSFPFEIGGRDHDGNESLAEPSDGSRGR